MPLTAGQQVMMQHGKSISPVELVQAGECRSCERADLWWARTKNKKMLLVVPPKDGQTIWQPHFADCAQGREWSKKR